MEYNKDDNETIVLLKGLKKGNAQKLKWTLTQSGFIISDIEPFNKNDGFLLHFPSKDLKQSSITSLNKYFEQQGISIDLYDIQVVKKELTNLEKENNAKEYVIGKSLIHHSSYNQLYPLHVIPYTSQIKNKNTQLTRLFYNLSSMIRSQYKYLSIDVPKWISDPRALFTEIQPFLQSIKSTDYRNNINLNIYTENGNVSIGIRNHYDNTITPYIKEICHDDFQNEVISQLLPQIESIVKQQPSKHHRLLLNIQNESSLLWQIISTSSSKQTQVEKSGIAMKENNSIQHKQQELSSFSIDYLHHTYQLLFGSFCYVNTEVTESLQLTISDWLTELVNINNEKKLSSNLLDLYCGSGFFSLQNAQLFNQVIGVDKNAINIKSAQLNQSAIHLSNISFIHNSCGSYCETSIQSLNQPQSNLITLVDPPKEGCHKKVMESIRNHPSITSLIYISSNPLSFRDDVKWLCFPKKNGYAPFIPYKTRGFDMLPGVAGYTFATLFKRNPTHQMFIRQFSSICRKMSIFL